jgi:hypothetical protein
MSDRINGMPADDAKAAHGIVERACILVLKRDPNEVFDTVVALQLSVGTSWSEIGTTMTYVWPRELFTDAADLRAKLEQRTREARLVAFPALAALDLDAAAPLFARSLPLDFASSHQVSFEGNLYRGLWLRYQAIGERLPPSTFAELFLAGRFALSGLSDAQVAAIPYEPFVQAVARNRAPYPGNGDAERVVKLLPALATLDGQGALAERIAKSTGDFARDLFPVLMRNLVAAKHPSATAAALQYLERMGPEYPYALSLIFAVDHRPTIERIAAELPARVAAFKPSEWDPHHSARELVPAIRAAYALGPETATDRFAAFFDPKRVADDVGSKVAWDIWMLGEGKLVDHDGTRLGTGDRPMVGRDPRWAPIAARLANHPRLGKAARWVVNVVAEHPKKLVAELALPERTWDGFATKKSKKTPAAKTAAKTVAKKTVKKKPTRAR